MWTGGPHMGYGQGQMGRMQQSMQYPPQAFILEVMNGRPQTSSNNFLGMQFLFMQQMQWYAIQLVA